MNIIFESKLEDGNALCSMLSLMALAQVIISKET